jgi:membrane peptidoglycan carboxypeptidase
MQLRNYGKDTTDKQLNRKTPTVVKTQIGRAPKTLAIYAAFRNRVAQPTRTKVQDTPPE